MRERFTDKWVAAAAIGIHRDSDPRSPRGLLLQVTAGGSRAFRFDYRRKSDGRQRRFTIGDVAAYPISEARKRAAELQRAVNAGGDPLGDAEDRRAAPTVADLAARFIAEELPSRAPRTQHEYKAELRDWILPALGKLKVAAVDRDDIERLHKKITAAGKARRANAVKSLCSTLFNQAIVWKMRDDNPCRLIKGNPEQGHERFLLGEELDRLIAVLERHRERRPDSVDAIMLAVLTGARRGEILSMRWGDLDLANALWVKPATLTKQRKLHRLTLAPEAVAILRRRQPAEKKSDIDERVVRLKPAQVVPLKPHGEGNVFSGGGSKTHCSAVERDWREFRAEAGLTDVRFHDLRHSVASWLIAAGMSLPVVGSVLGHSKTQTTQRYAHLSDRAQRDAVELVGKIVGGGGKQHAK